MLNASSNSIIVYQDNEIELEIRLDEGQETLWLTQQQISQLFGTSQQNIDLHIKNIYSEEELDSKLTYKKFLLVRKEGNRTVSREVTHYSLDMIISVGYRVNSKRATRFRQWATAILKSYITKGYAFTPTWEQNKELIEKINDIEKRLSAHDHQLKSVIDALRKMMAPPDTSTNRIGFRTEE